MPTRTRTVLFTDLADYTAKVARSDREELRALVAQHEALVLPIVRRYQGRVVKNLGDSFLCLFDAATDALRAALDLLAEAQGGPSLRLGLTTGDVEEIDGDAFGDAVNLAARLLAKASPGEAWFGPGTRACMNAAEIPWEPVGRLPLKGIAGDVDVYRCVPSHRCWLPERVVGGVRSGRLVRVRRGARLAPKLPPEPVVLLEDFVPGSAELRTALAALPVVDPACVFLAAWAIVPADRHAWTEEGRGLVVGTPAAIERALHEAGRAVARTTGADTILLEGEEVDGVDLVLAGLALPSVPLADVVASYFYELLPDGRWANESEQGVVRVEVGPDGATALVRGRGVAVDGRAVGVDERVRLRDGARVEVGGGAHLWRALDPHTGYVGMMLADTATRLGIVDGQTAEIGREPPAPGLALPDRRGQGNLRWCSGPRSAKAQAGGFTLDRALAGRRQAAVTLRGEDVTVAPLHDHCATWVWREGRQTLEKVARPARLQVGDHIVAGTTVVGLRRPGA